MRAEPAPVLSAQPTVIFTGAYGSGKTEVAINYALAARARGKAACIVDLDVVTPYFRVGDYREQLKRAGVRVVAPEGGLASFELPALPAEIAGALDDRTMHVVLDAGGNPEGARLLAIYADRIRGRGYDLWVVVNPFRPATSSAAAAAEQARAIEEQTGLRLTGVVANPNLGPATTVAEVRRGLEIIQQGAARLGLPVVLVAAARSLALEERLLGVRVLALELAVRLPWEGGSGMGA